MRARHFRLLKYFISSLIFSLGKIPGRPQLTIATAAVFCHRFYACKSSELEENHRQARASRDGPGESELRRKGW